MAMAEEVMLRPRRGFSPVTEHWLQEIAKERELAVEDVIVLENLGENLQKLIGEITKISGLSLRDVVQVKAVHEKGRALVLKIVDTIKQERRLKAAVERDERRPAMDYKITELNREIVTELGELRARLERLREDIVLHERYGRYKQPVTNLSLALHDIEAAEERHRVFSDSLLMVDVQRNRELLIAWGGKNGARVAPERKGWLGGLFR